MTRTISDLASAIERTYAPDVGWTDDDRTTVGREALEAKAEELPVRITNLKSPAERP
jgi:hypothetical protein